MLPVLAGSQVRQSGGELLGEAYYTEVNGSLSGATSQERHEEPSTSRDTGQNLLTVLTTRPLTPRQEIYLGDKDTRDTYEADDSILNPGGKGEHTEVTETDDEGGENTYDADDSILNPSGKGEHTEVTETRDDGTKDTYKADDSILNPSDKGEHTEVRGRLTADLFILVRPFHLFLSVFYRPKLC